MKKHSKLIAMLALVAMLAVVFTAAVSAMATPDEATFDEIAPAVSELPMPEIGGAIDDAEEKMVTTGGIIADSELDVTADTHSFKEEKLLLVTVGNNQADEAYSIELTVTYIAPDGTAIGTETKAFDQLSAGSEKNFIFRPEYDFADYRLEITKTLYTKKLWKEGINVEFKFWEYGFDYDDDRGWSVWPTVVIDNFAGEELIVTDIEVVLFDENGDIYDIVYKDPELWISDGDVDNYKQFENHVLVPDHMMIVADYITDCDVKLTSFMSYEILHPTQSPWLEDVMKYTDFVPNYDYE